MKLRAATRGSALALWQTEFVAGLMAKSSGVETEPVVVSTVGDRRLDVPIHTMGGKGVFVKEVQAAVLDGRADIAVHSGKDLPAGTPDGLFLGAIPVRGDARDALVGARLDDLAKGATVATGSVRRKAQLAWRRPDLEFVELRGNIATRLGRLDAESDGDEVHAIVMAAAALQRLGLTPDVVDILDPAVLLPQVAQGALVIECRADDQDAVAALSAIDHGPTRRVVEAERQFLAELGGDCDLPAGAHATLVPGTNDVVLTAMIASLDGTHLEQASRTGSDGIQLANELAHYLLEDQGGSTWLPERP